MFVVVEGAGKDMCCGQVGPKVPRFYTSVPSDCKLRSHIDKKEKVKPSHVYLGSNNGNRWLTVEAVRKPISQHLGWTV